jgi:hypothetical protein
MPFGSGPSLFLQPSQFSNFTFDLLTGVRQGAARTSPERQGPGPAFGEGTLVLTTAPWSLDHGDGNTRRLLL